MLRTDLISIPYLPSSISRKDLKDGKLLSEEEIAAYKSSPETSTTEAIKISKKGKALRSAILTPDNKLFAIGNPLGEGNMGRVRSIQDQDTLEWSTIKITYSSPTIDDQYVREEFNLLEQLDEAAPSAASNPFFFQQISQKHAAKKSYFSMKLKPGKDLSHLTEYHLHPTIILKIILNILKACQELESKKISHCDIKLENVIADPTTGEISLIDFGLSKAIDDDGKLNAKEISGTPKALAPEMLIAFFQLNGNSAHRGVNSIFDKMLANKIIPPNWADLSITTFTAEKTTMYSIGILASELLRLTKKYDTDFIPDRKHDKSLRKLPLSAQESVFNLAVKMLDPNPGNRATYAEAIETLTKALNISTKRCESFPITLLDMDAQPTEEMKKTILHLCVPQKKRTNSNKLSIYLADKKNRLEAEGYVVSNIAYPYSSLQSLRQTVTTSYAEMTHCLVINGKKLNRRQPSLFKSSVPSSSNALTTTVPECR